MIVVIDYGMGNLGSIVNMLKKIGAPATVTFKKEDVEAAEKVILPGVGAFDNAMVNLKNLDLIGPLNAHVFEKRKPLLGICLGMQLLAKGSEEGTLPGLGWLDAETVKFHFDNGDADLKIPHMGWNIVYQKKESPLLRDMYQEPRFYFVHSYHVRCRDVSDVLATTLYGGDFISAVHRENIFGAQFHPEKSHKFGSKLLENFVHHC